MNPLDTPLEVAGCRLYEVAVPLVEPFRISGGTLGTRRSLIVELTDRSGAAATARARRSSAPSTRRRRSARAGRASPRTCCPGSRGRAFPSLEAAVVALERGVRGNRMARAGVETALWDLVSARSGVSLRSLLGSLLERLGVPEDRRASRGYVESGAALGIPADGRVETLAGEARDAIRRGYRRVKLKVMPGWDVAPVEAVRRAVSASGRRVGVWVDANGAYDRERDAAALEALDRQGLVMIEQPLAPDDVLDTIKLCHELATPLCLDESLTGDRAAALFLESDGPRVWNLKVQRVGGLWECARIYRRAVQGGVRLWAGSMPETGVGMHAVLSLASFAAFVEPSDAAPSERWYEPGADLIEWRMDGRGPDAGE